MALQPDQPGARRRGQRLGHLRLADPGLALEQQRLLELRGEEDGGGQRAVGEVVLGGERRCTTSSTVRDQATLQAGGRPRSARRVSTRARWRL